ncbi:uncharacterized transposon-derived protein F54H12.3 [Caerostris extrusa]|uniref:Uncharacterized transposon-derived protein F54H12.3 n=1 Tax=Caerostris extrusa TaxID=172846 RepID=A0AAV4SCL5_CAEEX|nr:uncharacterized transposon-derived protein F54H12.3 [Caerostris extrusa]
MQADLKILMGMHQVLILDKLFSQLEQTHRLEQHGLLDAPRYKRRTEKVLEGVNCGIFTTCLRPEEERVSLAPTLRDRMYRVFSRRNSCKYLDILQPLIDSYNHSVHRSHGFAAANVTEADEPVLYKSLYNMSSPIWFRFGV